MSKESLLHSNAELWAQTHPKEAIWLPYIESEHLQFCKNSKAELNLKKKAEGKNHYYYTHANIQEETEQWFTQLDLKQTDVLFVYGVGLGYYYAAAKKWLKKQPGRHLVFLEDDLAVIYRLFQTDQGKAILKDDRVHLYYFQEVNDTEIIFDRLFWTFHMSNISFSALKFYEKTKPDKYAELKHKIAYDAALKNNLLEEYLNQYGIPFFRNFYPNLLALPEAYLGNALFGKFKNIPAIICGAGPSIEKNLDLLKTIGGDRAIIFAGSSALNALAVKGIIPHFGAGLDPNTGQEERLRDLPKVDFPFFYRNRFYPPALKLVKGEKLYVTGSGGYDISEWFEQQFNIQGEWIEEGRNIVNFCLELAYAMGCNPIIFVGVDLAYTGMKAYADGIWANPHVTEKEILQTESDQTTALLKEDIFGKPIYTLWKWIAEAQWIGDFAIQHPEITLINATEGGIGFPGIQNLSLKEALAQHLQRKFSLKRRIKQQIQSSKIPKLTRKKVLQAIKELESSLQRSLQHIEVLLKENQEAKELLKQKKRKELFQTGKSVLAETELAEEPAFIYVIKIFNDVLTKVLERDLESLHPQGKPLSKDKQALLRIDLNIKKLSFLKTVALINIELTGVKPS